jgi:hypothetical protein
MHHTALWYRPKQHCTASVVAAVGTLEHGDVSMNADTH